MGLPPSQHPTPQPPAPPTTRLKKPSTSPVYTDTTQTPSLSNLATHLGETEAEVLDLAGHEVLDLQVVLAAVLALVDGASVDLAITLPMPVVTIGTLPRQEKKIMLASKLIAWGMYSVYRCSIYCTGEGSLACSVCVRVEDGLKLCEYRGCPCGKRVKGAWTRGREREGRVGGAREREREREREKTRTHIHTPIHTLT